MSTMDTATQHVAAEIVALNKEINVILQQWLRSRQVSPDEPSTFVPDNAIQLMKEVDALLLIIGHAPKYAQVLAEHGIKHNVIDNHYRGE